MRRKQTPAPPKPDNLPEALFRNTSFITPKAGEHRQPLPPAGPSSGTMGFSPWNLCSGNWMRGNHATFSTEFCSRFLLAMQWNTDL